MGEYAVDPQRGTGVGEVLAFDPTVADRRAGDALVNTGESDVGVDSCPRQDWHAYFRKIVNR